MSQLINITTEEQWNDHVKSISPRTLQIISFHTPWAAPCAQMTTILRTLASSYPVTQPPSTSWVSMNAEDLMDISDSFGVTAVPFLVLTRNNKVIETVSGSDATKVRTAIEKHASNTPESSEGLISAATNSVPHKDDQNIIGPADPNTEPSSDTSGRCTSKEDLNQRLTNLVKAAPVMLFIKGSPSAPQCGFSRQLVALLRENTVKYGFFNILADDEVRQGLKEFADWPTYPQLWMNGELVGGLDIVKEEVAKEPHFFRTFSVSKGAASTAPPSS